MRKPMKHYAPPLALLFLACWSEKHHPHYPVVFAFRHFGVANTKGEINNRGMNTKLQIEGGHEESERIWQYASEHQTSQGHQTPLQKHTNQSMINPITNKKKEKKKESSREKGCCSYRRVCLDI